MSIFSGHSNLTAISALTAAAMQFRHHQKMTVADYHENKYNIAKILTYQYSRYHVTVLSLTACYYTAYQRLSPPGRLLPCSPADQDYNHKLHAATCSYLLNGSIQIKHYDKTDIY